MKNIKGLNFLPLPVLIIGTYDEEGKANAMNAAWGTQVGYDQILIELSNHKTTDNLKVTGEFTVAFATKKTEVISDYFGVVSGKNEDKIAKSGVHVHKGEFVNAPIIEEYPLTLECKVESFKNGVLIGKVVNMVASDDVVNEDGKVDVDKLEIITYDSVTHSYRELGGIVGKAFSDGNKLK